MAYTVITGFVGEDHAGQEFFGSRAGDALRTLMNREERSDAMPGAVCKIEAGFPMGDTGDRIDIHASRTGRKPERRDRDQTLEHDRIVPAHVFGWPADRDGARDIRRCVGILRSGINQIEHARLQFPRGCGGDPVMDDGAIGTGARNRIEREVTQRHPVPLTGFTSVRFELSGGGDLIDRARFLTIEPTEKTGHGGAVATMCIARSGDLGIVLAGAGQAGGIAQGNDGSAGGLDDPAKHFGGQAFIEAKYAAGIRYPAQCPRQFVRRADIAKPRQIGFLLRRQFAFVDKNAVCAIRRDNREGERERRMRNVAAAYVEGPGDGGGIGQDGVGCAETAKRRRHGGQFVFRGHSREPLLMNFDLRQWRFRPVGPNLVDRIGFDGDKPSAGLFEHPPERARFANRMKPRIEHEF